MSDFLPPHEPTVRARRPSITIQPRSKLPPSLFEPLQNLVARCCPDGRRFVLRPIGSKLHSSASLWTLDPQVPSPAGGSTLVVKHGAYAKQEYDALRRLWQAVSGTSLSATVPRPMAVDSEHRLLVMSHLPVRSTLWSLLFGSRRMLRLDHAAATQAFRACGHWLAQFQSASYATDGVPPELRQAQERLAEWPGFLRGLRDELSGRLREISAGVVPGPLVMSHGDFAPRNVHCSVNGVAVVDWEMMPLDSRSPGYDLEHFLVLLDRHRWWLALVGGPAHPLAQVFIRGYHEASPPVVPPQNRAAVQMAARVVVLDRQLKAIRRQPAWSLLSGRVGFVRDLAHLLKRPS